MASIYEIPNWQSGANTYSDYDVVLHGGKAYYARKGFVPNTDNHTPDSSAANGLWLGWTTFDSKTTPHFFWVPSYSASVASEPKVDVVKFGDGYEQRTPQNISSNLIKLSLSFNKRNEAETTAIAHFLNARGAQEAFAFTPPSPYGSVKKFVCRSWDVTMVFQDNYEIKATFEEVVE